MLTLIFIILSSTVISALVTGIVNSNMKRKELEVKIKLDEKNKWIANLDKKMNEHIENVNAYSGELMDYSMKKNKTIDQETEKFITDSIVNRLLTVKSTHNNLIFYIYQIEYEEIEKKKVEKIIGNITDIINKQKNQVLNYTNSTNSNITIQDLKKQMGKSERKLAKNTYKLSEKMGKLVRLEKMKMTDEILKTKKNRRKNRRKNME